MEPSTCSSRRREKTDFSLRELGLNERTNSRRFSVSHIRSFREDTKSFRSNYTISSTASSPGYPLRDEIDPSTYSFTTALKALQARSANYSTLECLPPDGFALNSKWDEAEKYICNPISGEVPLECLSSKTLSGRSFHKLSNRLAMSAPLVYSSRQNHIKKTMISTKDAALQFPIPEKRTEGMTRDVGVQSAPPRLSSSSPSPTSTPPIMERSIRRLGESPFSNANLKYKKEVEAKDTGEKEERKKVQKKQWNRKDEQLCRHGGCFSWLKMKKQREKEGGTKKELYFTD